jgi:hypothetical protein
MNSPQQHLSQTMLPVPRCAISVGAALLLWVVTVSGASQKAIVLRSSPVYESVSGQPMIPKGYLDKGDTCLIDSVLVDSSNAVWMRIARSVPVWTEARALAYVGADTGRQASAALSDDDPDRKRRLKILFDNSAWPHRIKKAVRDGQVCLDMNESQLGASWGTPFQKAKGFTLGIGDHEIWLFRNRAGEILSVDLRDGKVIGWLTGH